VNSGTVRLGDGWRWLVVRREVDEGLHRYVVRGLTKLAVVMK